MGVRSLKTVMEKAVVDGVKSVNIEEEIQNYKRFHNESPILAIDLQALAYLWSTLDNATVGMRANVAIKQANHFFGRLKNLGASLTFFDGGTIHPTKETAFSKHREESRNQKLAVIQCLEAKIPLRNLIKNHQGALRGSSTIVPLLKEVARQYGVIYAPFIVEKHTIIAGFATKKKALAVLGNDTNFLIYTDKWRFWSTETLNLKTLLVQEYNSQALSAFLRLTPEQMPLFATLAGNEVIPFEAFQEFHGKRGAEKRFQKIADYVRSQQFPLGPRDNEKIARNIFRENFNQFISKIEESLKSYDFMQAIAPETENDPFLRKLMVQEWTNHYQILKNIPGVCLSSYVDLRGQDFEKPFNELYLTLLKRHMGVLWQHKNERSLQLEVFVSGTANSPAGCLLVDAEYPTGRIPPLEKLIFRTESDGLDSERQKLLKFIIGPTLDTEKLFSFDSKFIPTIALLHYFVKEAGIEIEEADIFLLSVYETANNNADQNLELPEFLNLRAFKIVFLFIKLQRMLLPMFATLGFRDLAKHVAFDGLHFHLLWQQFEKLSGNEKDERLNCIREMRSLYDN